jgi:transposase
VLFVGDDWSEDHHDIEVQDEAGRVLARARLPEGVAGIDRLHMMIAAHTGDDAVDLEATVGIETERGPWVQALLGSGYRVHAINPLQVSRYRESHTISGAKSDAADAHVLAEMMRTEGHRLRSVAGDSERAGAIKIVARGHKSLIWERTRHTQRLRVLLREFYPAALQAFGDLSAAEALELLAKGPDPASAARLTITQITAALQHARRRKVAAKGGTDPVRAAQPAAAPTGAGDRRLCGASPSPSRDPGHSERAGGGDGGAGHNTFFRAPGR